MEKKLKRSILTRSSLKKRSSLRTSCFTLLELIVAVTIFSVVVSMATMGLIAIRKSWRKVHDNSKRLEGLLKVDRVVDTSFRNVIPFHWEDEATKQKRGVFVGEEDKVTFATLHRVTNADFSAIRFLHLYVEEGKLIAEYRKSPILTWEKNELGIHKEVLAENIDRISFMYGDLVDEHNIQWSSSWSEEKPRNYMPLAIQLTVYWKNGDEERWLRRTSGAGKFETLGVRVIKSEEGQSEEPE